MSMQEVWVQMIFLFFAKLEVVNEILSRVCFFLVVVLDRFKNRWWKLQSYGFFWRCLFLGGLMRRCSSSTATGNRRGSSLAIFRIREKTSPVCIIIRRKFPTCTTWMIWMLLVTGRSTSDCDPIFSPRVASTRMCHHRTLRLGTRHPGSLLQHITGLRYACHSLFLVLQPYCLRFKRLLHQEVSYNCQNKKNWAKGMLRRCKL